MSENQKVLRLLVVDDYPVVAEGIRTMLGGEPDIEVVGVAASGEEALEKAGILKPDVVLMDIKMPGMGGIEATRRIKKHLPQAAIVVFTMYESETNLAAALAAGASGFVAKCCQKDLLCQAVRAAVLGGNMVSSDLLARALRQASPAAGGPDTTADVVKERLTGRELEVLSLVGQGRSNREIAARLFLAEITVKKHVQSMMAKLGASDRTVAAITAVRLGLAERPASPEG
ncbi:MAG: response regulator transcription factor [Chloroflexi bacterium]|nr:response regulator transcription factor [Chloroflexota bacterium]